MDLVEKAKIIEGYKDLHIDNLLKESAESVGIFVDKVLSIFNIIKTVGILMIILIVVMLIFFILWIVIGIMWIIKYSKSKCN